MEAVLFQRHRIIATIVVFAIFAFGIAAAILRIPALEEAEKAAHLQAATRELAQASIAAALDAGRLDEADALLKKYRPVAGGALDSLNARYEQFRRHAETGK